MSDGVFVKVSEFVSRRGGIEAGWAVVATFAVEGAAEPRCIDYRVRAIPHRDNMLDQIKVRGEVESQMLDASMGADEIEDLGEFPAGGIPGFVFKEASQARLLDTARARVAASPERYVPVASEALHRVPVSRAGKVAQGRPWSRDLGERLAILADVERAYEVGDSRASVAALHHMSDSALRDLLHWARKTAEPPLFTDPGRGKKGGRLTQAARDILEGHDG